MYPFESRNFLIDALSLLGKGQRSPSTFLFGVVVGFLLYFSQLFVVVNKKITTGS